MTDERDTPPDPDHTDPDGRSGADLETVTAAWAEAGRKAVASETLDAVEDVHTLGHRLHEQLHGNADPDPADVQQLRREITRLYRVTEEFLAPMAGVDPYTGHLPIDVTPYGELRRYAPRDGDTEAETE